MIFDTCLFRNVFVIKVEMFWTTENHQIFNAWLFLHSQSSPTRRLECLQLPAVDNQSVITSTGGNTVSAEIADQTCFRTGHVLTSVLGRRF